MSFGLHPLSLQWTCSSYHSLCCLSRVKERPAQDRVLTLDMLFFQDIPRIWWMFCRWKVLNLFYWVAYVVHDSLLYSIMLMMQALYIFILITSLRLFATQVLRRVNIVAAFPILWLIYVSRERLSVMLLQGNWTYKQLWVNYFEREGLIFLSPTLISKLSMVMRGNRYMTFWMYLFEAAIRTSIIWHFLYYYNCFDSGVTLLQLLCAAGQCLQLRMIYNYVFKFLWNFF